MKITKHAINRYAERIFGIKESSQLTPFKQNIIINRIKELENHTLWNTKLINNGNFDVEDNIRFIVRNNTVVTVTIKREDEIEQHNYITSNKDSKEKNKRLKTKGKFKSFNRGKFKL
jgi:hypothetical protein